MVKAIISFVLIKKHKYNRSQAKLRQWMSEDFGKKNAELLQIYTQKIICEKYIEPDVWIVPLDYKFFCFNGEPKFLRWRKGRNRND